MGEERKAAADREACSGQKRERLPQEQEEEERPGPSLGASFRFLGADCDHAASEREEQLVGP